MPTLPPPPVPQQLREMLKDYPEHIDRLQQSLNRLVAKPRHGIGLFEQVIWVLEGELGAFMSEARAEVKVAEASGDAQAIAKAKEKRSVMGSALANMLMPDLRAYFEEHKEAFE